jgi:hypothetical protein
MQETLSHAARHRDSPGATAFIFNDKNPFHKRLFGVATVGRDNFAAQAKNSVRRIPTPGHSLSSSPSLGQLGLSVDGAFARSRDFQRGLLLF